MGKYGDIDFKVIKEDWNEYELEDGSILRGKVIVVKLLEGESGLIVNSTNVFGVLVPPELRGKPSPTRYSEEELLKHVVKEDIKFKVIKEDWNEYELEDGSRLFVKLTLVSVSKTDIYDPHGEPVYLINAQPIFKHKPSK